MFGEERKVINEESEEDSEIADGDEESDDDEESAENESDSNTFPERRSFSKVNEEENEESILGEKKNFS
jgi:hypothetical protein